jgi:RimJ/RimL family protein N-acetyltransferase
VDFDDTSEEAAFRAEATVTGPVGFSADGELRRRFEQDGLLGEDRGNLLVELEDGTLAGDVSYFAVFHGPNPGSRAFNVGIALLPEHRGRGHGSEAQREMAAK